MIYLNMIFLKKKKVLSHIKRNYWKNYIHKLLEEEIIEREREKGKKKMEVKEAVCHCHSVVPPAATHIYQVLMSARTLV